MPRSFSETKAKKKWTPEERKLIDEIKSSVTYPQLSSIWSTIEETHSSPNLSEQISRDPLSRDLSKPKAKSDTAKTK